MKAFSDTTRGPILLTLDTFISTDVFIKVSAVNNCYAVSIEYGVDFTPVLECM